MKNPTRRRVGSANPTEMCCQSTAAPPDARDNPAPRAQHPVDLVRHTKHAATTSYDLMDDTRGLERAAAWYQVTLCGVKQRETLQRSQVRPSVTASFALVRNNRYVLA